MKKVAVIIALLGILLSSDSCHSQNKELFLVSKGVSSIRIVIPENATGKEQSAASLLQHYIKMVSGCRLQIARETPEMASAAFYVGRTVHSEKYNSNDIKGEGFLIASDDKSIYIRGGSGNGIEYGVYGFAEQFLGCRKYADIPVSYHPTKNISIPARFYRVENPAFAYRESYYPQSADPEYLRWHKLHRFEDLWGIWGHSLLKIVPVGKYYSDHPDYYALVNGRRVPSQLCLNNKTVEEIVIAYLKQAIAVKPDAVYWSLGQSDNGGYCTCGECRKIDQEEGSPSGSLLRFVNRIAARFPEQTFTTLAYQYSADPPKRTKALHNVIIMLSDIEVDRKNVISDSHSALAFRARLKEWRSTGASVFVWDYTTQFTNYLAPFPDYDNLGANLAYFANNSVSGVFSQGSGLSYSDMSELNSYLQAKLLWNPRQDADQLKAEFLDGYYGKAGKFIAIYLKKLLEAAKKPGVQLSIYGNPIDNRSDYLSDRLINEYTLLFDLAETSVKDNAELLRRVKKARLSLEFAILQQARAVPSGRNGYLMVHGGGSNTIKANFIAKVRRFADACRDGGVKELSEGGISPEMYFKEWESILLKAGEHSIARGAKVFLAFPFSEDYPANREKTLVDGCFGSADYSYNWLFFYGNDMDATLDLGTAKNVRMLKMNFLHDPSHQIFNPVSIRLYVSLNGKAFERIEEKVLNRPEAQELAINSFLFNISGKVRYIRVLAKCPVSLPPSDLSVKKKPAICCDEIVLQ